MLHDPPVSHPCPNYARVFRILGNAPGFFRILQASAQLCWAAQEYSSQRPCWHIIGNNWILLDPSELRWRQIDLYQFFSISSSPVFCE